MRRSTLALLGAALLAATLVSDVHAASAERPTRRPSGSEGHGVQGQTLLRVHGGFSSPTGDFGDAFDSGLGFGGNIAYGVSRSLLFSAGVAYHGFDADGFPGDATVIPITFNLDAFFPTGGRVHPWIGGGMGLYNVEIDVGSGIFSASDSETNLGINFGAGFGAPAGDRGAWGVGFRYHHIFEGDTFTDLNFATLQVGYGFYL